MTALELKEKLEERFATKWDFFFAQASKREEGDEDYTFIFIDNETGFVKGTFFADFKRNYAYGIKGDIDFTSLKSLVDFLDETLGG